MRGHQGLVLKGKIFSLNQGSFPALAWVRSQKQDPGGSEVLGDTPGL